MTAVVEVRFKGNRKEYFGWSADQPLAVQDPVIVEVDRGEDFGRVSATGDLAVRKCGGGCHGCSLAAPTPVLTPERQIVRRASVDEVRIADALRAEEEAVRLKVTDRARKHDLALKVSDAERLDGVGRCGRQYCCSSWLPELRPVSLSLAKDQRLSLNPSQISGGCGRLLCCLRYEHDFYVSTRRRFPKEGRVVRTGAGVERVLAVDIFREQVTLRAEDGGGSARVVPLAQFQAELERAGA